MRKEPKQGRGWVCVCVCRIYNGMNRDTRKQKKTRKEEKKRFDGVRLTSLAVGFYDLIIIILSLHIYIENYR